MNLLNTLKRCRDIRRIFGEREIVIIEKQLLGVRLKPSEKTRLSRDIRKKFDAINELLPFSSEFELKHGAVLKEKINDAKEAILDSKYFPKINRIILFGSAAENNLALISDIDIAVEFYDISNEEATKFRIEISGKVSEKIDVQVYNVLPDKVKKEIDLKGRTIYESKNQR
ncbi:MAG: nucleotidyltransferase domain-containing protein [Nanoarchaeota archaeon]|nr:nucleotidyltransferase domain-containing protein [Nanoarchaeota archaeon]